MGGRADGSPIEDREREGKRNIAGKEEVPLCAR